jgi:TPR repeat protein
MISQIAASLLALGFALLAPPQASPPSGQADAALEAKVKALGEEAMAAQAKGDQATMLAKFDAIVVLTRNPEAMHKLGHFYEGAKDVPGAPGRARHWFVESAKLGVGEAQKDLAKALEAEASLSDEDYAILVDALAAGAEKAFNHEGNAMLKKLAAKYGAAAQCGIDAAKRLGYVADDSQALMSRGKPPHWYRVRSGSGASSRGDRIDIYGASDDNMFRPGARYARLKLGGSGFTGIKVTRYPASEGRYLKIKEYTGYVETPSAEGGRDIEMIAKTCRG